MNKIPPKYGLNLLFISVADNRTKWKRLAYIISMKTWRKRAPYPKVATQKHSWCENAERKEEKKYISYHDEKRGGVHTANGFSGTFARCINLMLRYNYVMSASLHFKWKQTLHETIVQQQKLSINIRTYLFAQAEETQCRTKQKIGINERKERRKIRTNRMWVERRTNEQNEIEANEKAQKRKMTWMYQNER